MGFNTTVVILNDALGDIERDPSSAKSSAQSFARAGHRTTDSIRGYLLAVTAQRPTWSNNTTRTIS